MTYLSGDFSWLSQFQNSICQKIFDPIFFFQHMIFDTQKNIFDLKKIFFEYHVGVKNAGKGSKMAQTLPGNISRTNIQISLRFHRRFKVPTGQGDWVPFS